jgi:REP element-mobilizing transposase RayT
MPDSKARAYVHFVWATKGRRAIIGSEREREAYPIISGQVTRAGCKVVALNGTADHVHLLVPFGRNVSFAQLMNQVKGVASRFMNDRNAQEGLPEDFLWQPGYGAFTLGREQLPAVVAYVRKQKLHHGAEGVSVDDWEDCGET